MNIRQITSVYFSPTGNTKTVMELIAGQLSDCPARLDLTGPGKRPEYHFLENEAVLVGVPVYGGRVPAVAAERLKKLHGRRTAAVLVVTYGNRAYEDALLELKLILIRQGFRPVAAAAVPAEHNIVRSIAQGRPDKQDRKKLKYFTRDLGRRFWELESNYRIGDLKTPGSRPFRKYHGVPLKIKAGPSCKKCGLCAELPCAGNFQNGSEDHRFRTVYGLYALCQAVSVRCPPDSSCDAAGSKTEAEKGLCREEGSRVFYGVRICFKSEENKELPRNNRRILFLRQSLRLTGGFP